MALKTVALPQNEVCLKLLVKKLEHVPLSGWCGNQTVIYPVQCQCILALMKPSTSGRVAHVAHITPLLSLVSTTAQFLPTHLSGLFPPELLVN